MRGHGARRTRPTPRPPVPLGIGDDDTTLLRVVPVQRHLYPAGPAPDPVAAVTSHQARPRPGDASPLAPPPTALAAGGAREAEVRGKRGGSEAALGWFNGGRWRRGRRKGRAHPAPRLCRAGPHNSPDAGAYTQPCSLLWLSLLSATTPICCRGCLSGSCPGFAVLNEVFLANGLSCEQFVSLRMR